MNKFELPGNIFNESDGYIEKKITFKQINKYNYLFKNPPFQTDIDENKIIDMITSYKKNPTYFAFKNTIVCGVICKNDNITLYLLDGQHRLKMIEELVKEDINDYLYICYYHIKTNEEMKELFKSINKDSHKINNYISLDEFNESLYDLTKEYLKTKYSLYFPERKSQINRRHSLTEFLDLLVQKLYFQKFTNIESIINDIEMKNKKFNKLIDYQEYYLENPEMFYKDEQLCVKNGFIISLKNNNFIDFLVDETVIPDHTFKNLKKSIPPKLRIQVWRKEFNDEDIAYCPFYRCENIIRIGVNGFHCGHVISEFNGGQTNIDNLRPICSDCNCKMATMNWSEYEKLCKKEYRNKKKLNQNIIV